MFVKNHEKKSPKCQLLGWKHKRCAAKFCTFWYPYRLVGTLKWPFPDLLGFSQFPPNPPGSSLVVGPPAWNPTLPPSQVPGSIPPSPPGGSRFDSTCVFQPGCDFVAAILFSGPKMDLSQKYIVEPMIFMIFWWIMVIWGVLGCIRKIKEKEGKRNPIPGLGVRTLHPDFGKHFSEFWLFFRTRC